MTPSPPASELLRPRLLAPSGRSRTGRSGDWSDLAPEIIGQRLVIEGVPARPINDAQIRSYLDAGTVVAKCF